MVSPAQFTRAKGRLPASIKPLHKAIILVRVGGYLCRVRVKTFLRAVACEATTMNDESELPAAAGVVAFVRALHGSTDFPLTVANVGRQVHLCFIFYLRSWVIKFSVSFLPKFYHACSGFFGISEVSKVDKPPLNTRVSLISRNLISRMKSDPLGQIPSLTGICTILRTSCPT